MEKLRGRMTRLGQFLSNTVARLAPRIRKTSDYVYSKLANANSIRLLQLEPGAEEDKLKCTLLVVPLDTCPEYEAVSYVWGDSSKRLRLSCSNGELEVTENLHSALRRFRRHDKPRTLWADAICINQEDTSERSQQILLMGMIYAKAQRVLVWLGPTTKNDRKAFQSLKWLLSFWGDIEVGENLHKDPQKWNEFWKTMSTYTAAPENVTTPIMHLLLRPWFERVWVIQEVARARHVVVVHGRGSITYQKFVGGIYICKTIGLATFVDMDLSSIRGTVWSNVLIMNFCKDAIRDGNFHLLKYLCLTRNFKSTDPRDKFYALLGMMEDPTTISSRPDYAKDPREVFTEIAVDALIHQRQLPILSCSSHEGTSEISRDLPSWVPDWALPSGPSPFITFGTSFEAAGKTAVDTSISSDNRTLTIRGRIVNPISQIATRIIGEDLPDAALDQSPGVPLYLRRTSLMHEHFLLWLKECHQIALGNDCITPEAYERSKHDRLLRAIICDMETDAGDGGVHAAQLRNICREMENVVAVMKSEVDLFPDGPLEGEVAERVLDAGTRADELMQHGLCRVVLRRFCCTDSGHLGLVPIAAKVGDRICVFFGAHVLHVLRPDSDDHYRLIGECYLQGLMNGEALEMNGTESQYFKIR